jgi:hypothetical protein
MWDASSVGLYDLGKQNAMCVTCNKHCVMHVYFCLIQNLVLFTKVMHTQFGSSMNLILAKEIFIKVSTDERY